MSELAPIVTAICAVIMMIRQLGKGVRFFPSRPSIWTRTGRLLLPVQAWLRHPLSAEERADFEYWQGFNDPEFVGCEDAADDGGQPSSRMPG